MNFSTSVSTVFSKYATFSGRASRSEYWYYALFIFIVECAISVLGFSYGGSANGMAPWAAGLSSLFGLATFLPTLAVSVRRLHDTGRGGGWIFITLLPAIGQIWYLILMILPSENGDNRFGPEPY